MKKIKMTRSRLPQGLKEGIAYEKATKVSFNEWKAWLQEQVEENQKRRKVFNND